MKKGETKDIEITFPENYFSQQMAGKKVTFKVTVNSIHKVNKPELNAEYFEKFKLPNIKSEEDFKKYISTQLSEWKKYKSLQDFQQQFSEQILKVATLDSYPKVLLNDEMKRIDKETNKIAEEKKMTKAHYLKQLGYENDKTYTDGLLKTAQRNITFILALEKIAKDLKIEVTEADYEEYYNKLAKLYNMDVEEVKKKFSKNIEGIQSFIYQSKIFEQLYKIYTTK